MTLDAVLAVKAEELAAIQGVGDIIAKNVVDGLAAARPIVDDLAKYVGFAAPAGEHAHGPWTGKSFVFTGKMVAFARSDGEKRVQERGGDVLSSVTKNLTFLVVGADKTGPKSTKEKAAEKLLKEGAPLRVLSEEEFLAMLASAVPDATDASSSAPENVSAPAADAAAPQTDSGDAARFDSGGQGSLF